MRERTADKRRSRRLGASQIGKSCLKALYLDFRWAKQPTFDGRMYRLFETGYIEEPRIIKELIDAKTFKLIETKNLERSDETGHFVCKPDGIGVAQDGENWLLEFKRLNEKGWKHLDKHGLRQSKPVYWAQVMVGLELFGLKRGLFVATNKNNDDIYSEVVTLEENGYLEKASTIIEAQSVPPGISDKADWFECKFCDYNQFCFGVAIPDVHCRTCVDASPAAEGKWGCYRKRRELNFEEQQAGCSEHSYKPGLCKSFSDPQNAKEF